MTARRTSRARGILVLLLTSIAISAAVRAAGPAGSNDPIQSLIEGEKQAYEDWLSAEEEAPVATLIGTTHEVELYSPSERTGEDNAVCSDPDLDSLVEMSGGDPQDDDNALNLYVPRVREAFGDACLVRPTDRVVGVGPGWREERNLGAMSVRRETPACPQDPPLALWSTLDRPFPSTPFYITTDPTVSAGSFTFTSADHFEKRDLSQDTRDRLEKTVPLIEDYRAAVYAFPDVPGAELIVLTRKEIRGDDNDLPAVSLFVSTGTGVSLVWTERVNSHKGTGSFTVSGVGDVDGDGEPEIIVSGVHERCPYTSIFKKTMGGWEPMEVPVRACHC